MGGVLAKCKLPRCFKDILDRLSGKAKARKIYIVGLANAGKTSILYQFKFNEAEPTVPTIGFNVETFKYNNVLFTAWDFSGREQLRPLWRYYFDDTTAVIFVVDSTSKMLLQEAAEVLHGLFQVEELNDVPFLVFLNKQDASNCMSADELTDGLRLSSVVSHRWHVQPCSAHSGEGLHEGMDWLCRVVAVMTIGSSQGVLIKGILAGAKLTWKSSWPSCMKSSII